MRVLLILALFSLGGCATPASTTAPSALEQAVRARSAALVEAETRRDAVDSASFFADDAVLIVPQTTPIVGREAIEAAYKAGYAYAEGISFDSSIVELRVSADGTMAWERGHNVDTVRTKDGTEQTWRTNYLLVWEHAAGTWWVRALSVTPAPQ